MDDELNNLIYFQNGDLNAPFILANANLLLKEGEPRLAASLFLKIARNKNYAYCGYYGLSKCFAKMLKPKMAVTAVQKAFLLSRRPYLALALVEALLDCENYPAAEKMALELAVEFASEKNTSDDLRRLYEKSIQLQSC